MNTDLVIKVKYGETLRRFNVLNGNGSLDLDLARLTTKIFGLFNFTPDADLKLTYVDEDGDMVALVDDVDLNDAIKQRLNPLRITVSLNSDVPGKFDNRSRSSTPMRSPRTSSVGTPSFLGPQPSHDPGTNAASSIEAPFSKFVRDMTFKAASAAAASPALFELVEALSKLGITHQDPVSEDQVRKVSKISSESGEVADCKISDSSQTSKDPVSSSEVLPKAGNDNSACNAGNMTRGVRSSDPRRGADLEAFFEKLEHCPRDLPDLPPSGFTSWGAYSNSGKMARKECDGYTNGNHIAGPSSLPSSAALPGQGLAVPAVVPNSDVGNGQAGWSSSVPVPWFYHNPPSRRSYENCDNMGRVFHQGVCCDGCGVHPIIGPRYKSKVKVDYDLCSICFENLGNEADYTRMDRPLCSRSPRLSKVVHPRLPKVVHQRLLKRPLVLPQVLRSGGLRSSFRPKLDSRFLEDVNIVDGTLMAPFTPFTKIWRMHNNGSVAWPRGTTLVWIGGDKLTDEESSELEIPVDGCLVGMDLNVAIQFTAPEHPGQYVSYWKMALPSGQKFGQCVWVLIQVDTPQRGSPSERCRNLNLNFPPDSGDLKDQILDSNVEPVDASHPMCDYNVAAELVKPIVDGCTGKYMEIKKDGLVDGNNGSVSILPEVLVGESSASTDLSAVQSESTTLRDVPPLPEVRSESIHVSVEQTSSIVQPELASSADVQTSSGVIGGGSMLEQSLLKELEEMGFKEIDLNKEILRVNEYDLDRSLDHLCGVAEWDPMLEELEEMGFSDKETNRKLLMKNGGSIKRVVMDLIAAEMA